MDDKKKYVKPEAEVVDFINEDIVTVSDNETKGWYEDGYQEEW